MHAFETIDSNTAGACDFNLDRDLDFLWLELTNRCNLQCIHCYTESHPTRDDRDVLTKQDYESIMLRAYELGCRKIQFIGGEPQLSRHFKSLLRTARETGYEFIEVFSNLTFLDDETLEYSADNQVCFATSMYSDDPAVHNAVTKVGSSHVRTVGNLKKLIANGIVTRAGIIIIDQDDEEVERTKRFLEDLGVGSVCVMARQWSVGNLFQDPLSEIVGGKALKNIRRAIFDSVWLPKIQGSISSATDPRDPRCHPDCSECCDPDSTNCPETPCGPQACPQSCVPDIAR